MKFCYIKDLNIPWFVGMVERSKHLPSTVFYDDTYVHVSEDPPTETEKFTAKLFTFRRSHG